MKFFSKIYLFFILNIILYTYTFLKGCNIAVIIISSIISIGFLRIIDHSLSIGVVNFVGRRPIFLKESPILFYLSLGLFYAGYLFVTLLVLSSNFFAPGVGPR